MDIPSHVVPGGRTGRSAQAGMTLIEVMIAVGLTAMALILTMGSVISISDTSKISEDQTLATAVASGVLEELRGLSYEELMAYQPAGQNGLGSAATISVACYDGSDGAHFLPMTGEETAESTALPIMPNPMRVEVTVSWRDRRGRPYSTRATTYYGR